MENIRTKWQKERLRSKFQQREFLPGLLLHGPRDMGKFEFALELVKLFYCQAEDRPCHTCLTCIGIQDASHQYIRIIRPEQPKKTQRRSISIQKVLELHSFLTLMIPKDSLRAVIVDEAERLTPEAQNAFLKTIEEPQMRTVIILVTSSKQSILPTIISRLQSVHFTPLPSAYLPNLIRKGDSEDRLNTIYAMGKSKNFKQVSALSRDQKDDLNKQIKTSEAILNISMEERFRVAEELSGDPVSTRSFLDVLTSLLYIRLRDSVMSDDSDSANDIGIRTNTARQLSSIATSRDYLEAGYNPRLTLENLFITL